MAATIKFIAVIERFGEQGEKTGWTYIRIPQELASQLHSTDRKSFHVKGMLDNYAVTALSLIPMGEGEYILPLNGGMRSKLKKRKGEKLNVQLSKDETGYILAEDFLACLKDEPPAWKFFQTLNAGHQKYFSRWIDSAKTQPTRDKRITRAVNALSRGWGYPEMIKAKDL